MKLLDWYILKRFLQTYVFVVLVIVLVVVMIDYTEKVDNFHKTHAPANEILWDYYLNFIPYWANYISPLMVFIATVFLTSRLAARTEIIAARVGISLVNVFYFETNPGFVSLRNNVVNHKIGGNSQYRRAQHVGEQ